MIRQVILAAVNQAYVSLGNSVLGSRTLRSDWEYLIILNCSTYNPYEWIHMYIIHISDMYMGDKYHVNEEGI